MARARLQRQLERLTSALRGGSHTPAGSAWPGARVLLLLKLWATVFPASDRRHAVLTPAALLAGACLALCPLARPSDVAQGAPLDTTRFCQGLKGLKGARCRSLHVLLRGLR